MNRTIEDIQKDIELLGIKGGYDIEQLLTPQDCRRLSYEIEKLNNTIEYLLKFIEDMFDEEAISNSFDMTTKEFINYIKSKLKGE